MKGEKRGGGTKKEKREVKWRKERDIKSKEKKNENYLIIKWLLKLFNNQAINMGLDQKVKENLDVFYKTHN